MTISELTPALLLAVVLAMCLYAAIWGDE